MENIKVSVKHNDWSEVFDMLVELGAKQRTVKSKYGDKNGWLFVHEDIIWTGLLPHNEKECRVVEFSELKDMVVLKRNSIDDANAHRHDNSVHYYITSNNEYFFFLDGKWACSNKDISYLKKYVKPIKEKDVKEFLVYYDDKWTLRLLDSDTQENIYRVAVPSGASVARDCDGFIEFYKNDFSMFFFSLNKIWRHTISNKSVLLQNIVWQRSETESLNDQYAGIKELRKEGVKATIDGVEAFNAIANDITVQYRFAGGEWKDYTQDLNHEGSKLKAVHFLCDHCEFRYKPKTIVVNGVEYEDEQKAVNVVKDYFKRYVK